MVKILRGRQRDEPPGPPHFFKIILSETLQSGKLIIPKKFIAKHGNRLSNQLLLKVAGDANWPVEIEKCDDKVWICKGWRNFMDYYSIDYGHLVVFRYEGDSIFHVLIFDKSASEIEYPGKPIAPKKLLDPEIIEIDVVSKSPTSLASSDKLMTKCDPVSEDRNKYCEHLLMPHYEAKSSLLGDRRTLKLTKNMRSYCSSRDYGGRTKESGKKTTPFEQIHLKSTCPKPNPTDALKNARKFKSEHPSFLIVMQRSYLKHSNVYFVREAGEIYYFIMSLRLVSLCANGFYKHVFDQHVPSVFMKSHIRETPLADATLKFRGRSWTVKFYSYLSTYGGRFSTGWVRFATDNSLSTGDVCVFELIERTPMVFKVSIFRCAG